MFKFFSNIFIHTHTQFTLTYTYSMADRIPFVQHVLADNHFGSLKPQE